MNQLGSNSQISTTEQDIENSPAQQEDQRRMTTDSSAPQDVLLLDTVLLENDENQMIKQTPRSSAVNSS